jgi:hypothetical protein
MLIIEESTWNHYSTIPCGIHVKSMECLWNIPCGYSIWIPWIPGGFQLFHVEYAWNKNTNLGGISPKTYSIWNGWNPSGMTWIPCGMWGQGKDLKSSAESMLHFKSSI